MDLVGPLYSDEQLVLEVYGDHNYAVEMNEQSSSERTRGLNRKFNEERNPSTIDECFLNRAGNNIQNVLRPVECLIDYQSYRKTLHLAAASANELTRASARFYALPHFLEEYDGTLFPIAWPKNKCLRLTSEKSLGYSSITSDLKREYPLCDEPLQALGVILSSGQSLYSDIHPVLIISLKGQLFIHIRGRPVWSSDYDPEVDRDRLYFVAETLQTFAKDGLVRCDAIYTDAGGVPYAMQEDAALKEITSIAPRNAVRLINVLDKWQDHTWFLNGCPGMLKDRMFVISHTMPQYVKQSYKERYGTRFCVIGRVIRSLEDKDTECELYVVIDSSGTIFAYLPDTGIVRRLAQSFDMFLRIGTRSLYFNFEILPYNRRREFEDNTFITQQNSGFFLLSRELLSIRRVRP